MSAGMDGWELLEAGNDVIGYRNVRTGEMVDSIDELPQHVQAFLASETREGRR